MPHTIKCENCGHLNVVEEALYRSIQQDALAKWEKDKAEMLESERRLQKAAFERERRELEQKHKREVALQVQKELKARHAEAERAAEDKYRIQLQESKVTISRLRKDLEKLSRKANPVCPEPQGTAGEMVLENIIRAYSPDCDEIQPIKKGGQGADRLHIVKLSTKEPCARILWEAKTGEWKNGWIAKIKQDQKRVAAQQAVIVTRVLPPKKNGSDQCFIDGVWICEYRDVPLLTIALRTLSKQLKAADEALAGRDEKEAECYRYMHGKLRERMSYVKEVFRDMDVRLKKDEKQSQDSFKNRRQMLQKAVEWMIGLWDDLNGLGISNE